MNPHASRALELVLSVYDGEPWHGPSIASTLAGVTAAQASERPARGVHSIWELVLHLSAWTREVASRLAGNAAKDPAEGDWPSAAQGSEDAWQSALRALHEAQRELEAAAGHVADSRWDARVAETREALAGFAGATHLETLEGLAAHHAYHAGQIAMLKKWLSAGR